MPGPEPRHRILVVDDDPLVIASLELLFMERYEVRGATSATEARAVAQCEDIAVAVVDMRMPGETGVDLLAWLYEHHPSTVRILLTGYADFDAVVAAINHGRAWYYLRKPWDNHELLTLVRRAVEFREKELEVVRNFKGTIRSLVTALEANHPYTRGHSTRVTRYADLLCAELGLGTSERALVVLAAELHDVGKIGVDSHYLDKEGVLSERERADVRRHVQIGERILREAGFLDAVIPLMGSHHEALDGSGYPRGLSGAEIPLGGRIIAIADAFDAMASDRAYRPALPAQAGLSELRRCAGAQFDPDLVERFCRLIEREGPSIGAGDPRPAP